MEKQMYQKPKEPMSSLQVRKISVLGMLGALSLVLVLLFRIPLIPLAPFLEYDPADIPILIGTFAYGPGAGLALTVVVSLIQGLTVSSSSGPIGIIMHIVATGLMVLVVGFIYGRSKKSLSSIILAVTVGSLVMVGAMVALNLIAMPLFLKVPRAQVVGMIAPAIIPFNSLKAVINSVFAVGISKALEKAGIFESKA